MTRPRARWPNGSMSNCLQPSPHVAQIQTQVSPEKNSSSSEHNDNTTDLPDDSPCQPTMKRKRGWAKPYINWGTDKKLIVELNSHNQPIGKTASKLASQLGVIARNAIYCPITYTSWKCKGLDQNKECIWRDVKDNCEVSNDYKENCLMSVGDKWRKWKARVKKEHYYIFDNDEERLANVPARVKPSQWKLFVQYQGSDMAKARSETNRENQSKKVMSHTSGRKSHQVVREELIAKGKKGDRIDVYLATHTNSDKIPVDEEAAKAIDAITTKLQVVPEAQHTAEFREKVFTDVFGHDTHGRVRTFGKGPSPTEIFGRNNKKSHEQHARDLERVREEGRKEGRQEGWEKGREEGLEEGRKEYKDRLEHVEKILEIYNLTAPKSPNEKLVHVQQISDAGSSHHQSSDSSDFLFEVGMNVDLLNVELPKKVVAKGILVSKDPKKKLGGVPVGDGFWVVQITKAILPHEKLLIGRGNMRKVGHAIKQNVAWRKVDIKIK